MSSYRILITLVRRYLQAPSLLFVLLRDWSGSCLDRVHAHENQNTRIYILVFREMLSLDHLRHTLHETSGLRGRMFCIS